MYNITCPQNAYPGQTIEVQIPKPQAEVIMAEQGAVLLNHAYDSPNYNKLPSSSSSSSSNKILVAKSDQIVDENNEEFRKHDIISVYAGEEVELLSGDTVNGCADPYQEYVLVKRQDQTIGRVSKYVF